MTVSEFSAREIEALYGVPREQVVVSITGFQRNLCRSTMSR